MSNQDTGSPDSANGPKQKRHLVYSLHGIRTHGWWQSQLSKAITDETAVEVRQRNYLIFDLVMFVLKNIFYHQPLRLVEKDLSDFQDEYRVSVIAHSFGTWLLLKALTDDPKIKLNVVILCGSILPRASSVWRRFKNNGQIEGPIVNFCGRRDPFPALAELLSRDYGASGVVGLGDPNVVDSFHDCGHSGFLTEAFCKRFFNPLIRSKSLPLSTAANRPRGYISAILWAAAHRGLLAISTIALIVTGILLYKSELSCRLRDCFIDVVRVDNYASSTRLEGNPRAYVAMRTYRYSFNYDLTYYELRAPKASSPSIVAFTSEGGQILKGWETTQRMATNDTASREQLAFRIPVENRQAHFIIESTTKCLEPPTALAAQARRPIRNLYGIIIMPDNVALIPATPEGFRASIEIKGQKLPADSGLCKVSQDGRTIDCQDLHPLPAHEGFRYLFKTRGWSDFEDEGVPRHEECKPFPR